MYVMDIQTYTKGLNAGYGEYRFERRGNLITAYRGSEIPFTLEPVPSELYPGEAYWRVHIAYFNGQSMGYEKIEHDEQYSNFLTEALTCDEEIKSLLKTELGREYLLGLEDGKAYHMRPFLDQWRSLDDPLTIVARRCGASRMCFYRGGFHVDSPLEGIINPEEGTFHPAKVHLLTINEEQAGELRRLVKQASNLYKVLTS